MDLESCDEELYLQERRDTPLLHGHTPSQRNRRFVTRFTFGKHRGKPYYRLPLLMNQFDDDDDFFDGENDDDDVDKLTVFMELEK